MTSLVPLVRIVVVSVLLALAGLMTAFSLGAHHTLPLVYGDPVEIVVPAGN